MIRLENVTKVYSTDRVHTTALSSIDLEIQAGEFVSIMGPSGCGKSTLLNILGLLDEPTSGTVTIENNMISSYRDRELADLRNTKMGFVFQSFHLIGDLSIIDNVELPLLYRKIAGRERRRRSLETLTRVGLESRAHHYPGQLSGGQQQRAAIARAIVGEPQIILADEPTGNLDSKMGMDVMGLLLELNQASSTTVVMVTHDPRLADRCDRSIHLFDGQQVP